MTTASMPAAMCPISVSMSPKFKPESLPLGNRAVHALPFLHRKLGIGKQPVDEIRIGNYLNVRHGPPPRL